MQITENERNRHFLREGLERLEVILRSRGMLAFEYYPAEDMLTLYNDDLQVDKVISGYAAHLRTSEMTHPQDRSMIVDFFLGKTEGPIEIRTKSLSGGEKRRVLDGLFVEDSGQRILVGYTRDVTEERKKERLLEERARRDPMTKLYNRLWGKELIEEYLRKKPLDSSCGLLLIDIDYFKEVNDTYGHLFGDRVLVELADILHTLFERKDVVMRSGGDEFVVLLKDIDNKSLVKKVMQLLQKVRECAFEEKQYSMRCSIGVCFLPENLTGYTYDQLFENADWALYQAKLNGRDRYEFCDNLQRFRVVRGQSKMIAAHLPQGISAKNLLKGTEAVPGYDSLTGLLSFTRFREEVHRLIIEQYANSHIMVYGDFENFRFFNKKYGYEKGDHLLKEFSNYVIEQLELGTQSYFSRVVSDQFVLFMPYVKLDETIEKIRYINEAFARDYNMRYPESQLQIRAGIYPITENCEGASIAIDAANYARKQIIGKKDSYIKVYDDALQKRQQLDNEIINGIDEALSQRQFQIYLQPKVSLKDGTIVGAEAQVRWYRSDGTILTPGYFIPLYERNGRIIDLDLYVFERVVEYLAKNERLGRKQVPISINASVLHASRANTVERYLKILEKYQVDPKLTEMELLESTTAANYESVKTIYRLFQEAGMKTSLDDFGAGYSMIHILADIPVDTVKLDRSLLEWCDDDGRGFYLLQQIVNMVKGLGYDVLCEGVENEKQVEILKKTGCDHVQGYLFYKPMPISEFEKIMYENEKNRENLT